MPRKERIVSDATPVICLYLLKSRRLALQHRALTQGDNARAYREGKEDLCSQLGIPFRA
jgi:hypothetical protein